MKIGLVTIYNVPNYGSVLQAFATQKLFEKLGHECELIQYNYRNNDYFQKIGKKRDKFKEWLLDYLPFIKSSKLNSFRKKRLNFSRKFETYLDLVENNWDSFDLFFVGSDQVWNTRFLLGDPAFLLKFVPDSKPRYSLSSSFAMETLPENYISLFKEELSKFTALSVREQNGVRIIKKDLGISKDVKVILDPTLLLSKKDWLDFIPRSNFKKKRPYILLYMLNYAFEPRPYILRVVEYFKNKLSADVIVLEGHRDLKELHCSFIDANRSSISKFIDLFANADLVITSSFHGTAFAINFGIPLISIVPEGNGDDRQSSLLKSVCAESSIVPLNTDLNNVNPQYDTFIVSQCLKGIRCNNIDWVKSILE